MGRSFRGRLCRFAIVVWLVSTALWLLLQQYTSYQVQQRLAELNQQYRLYAAEYRWPLLQLKAGSSRFIPWLDRLEIPLLELTLPNGASLVQLSGLELRGLLQLDAESLSLSSQRPAAAMSSALSYQLSWRQLALSPALQQMLPAELQLVLQPVTGVVSWQQNKQQLHSQIRLQMADQLLLQTALQLTMLQAEADGQPPQLTLQRLTFELQQQLLPALQPWLANQGFASESLLFKHWQQQLAGCTMLPDPVWQAFLAWQQQPEQFAVDWQPEPALSLLQWPHWGCSRISS